MTNLPPWMNFADTLEEQLGADTFEAPLRMRRLMKELDWFAEHGSDLDFVKIRERLDEVSPRGKAA